MQLAINVAEFSLHHPVWGCLFLLCGISAAMLLVHLIHLRLLRSTIYLAIFIIPWAMVVYGASVQLAPAKAAQIGTLAKHGLATPGDAKRLMHIFESLGVRAPGDLVFWRAKDAVQIITRDQSRENSDCDPAACFPWIFSPGTLPPGELRSAGQILRVIP